LYSQKCNIQLPLLKDLKFIMFANHITFVVRK
jgi:hypothetical protein